MLGKRREHKIMNEDRPVRRNQTVEMKQKSQEKDIKFSSVSGGLAERETA